MKASIIMPCWINDPETFTVTTNAVESFVGADERHPDLELILIDNGGTVGSGWLRSVANIYLRYRENMGYTHAINDGIKIAHGEILALANNDIRVAPNWLEVATEILKDETVATLHPKMVDYNAPFSLGDSLVFNNERLNQNSFTLTKHRDLLFDEGYGIGGGADDWDFAWQIHLTGLKRVATDRTAFQHQHSHSLKKLGEERARIVAQNNELFKSKWGKVKEELFREAGLI